MSANLPWTTRTLVASLMCVSQTVRSARSVVMAQASFNSSCSRRPFLRGSSYYARYLTIRLLPRAMQSRARRLQILSPLLRGRERPNELQFSSRPRWVRRGHPGSVRLPSTRR